MNKNEGALIITVDDSCGITRECIFYTALYNGNMFRTNMVVFRPII